MHLSLAAAAAAAAARCACMPQSPGLDAAAPKTKRRTPYSCFKTSTCLFATYLLLFASYLLLICCLIAARAPAGEWSRIAPLRILSIDIECAGRKGHFPEAQLDPVIQIASMVTVLGENKPRVKNIMTLGSCAAIVGAEVSGGGSCLRSGGASAKGQAKSLQERGVHCFRMLHAGGLTARATSVKLSWTP
jgi:hypothetical protein